MLYRFDAGAEQKDHPTDALFRSRYLRIFLVTLEIPRVFTIKTDF
jgi:hypothetical protein